MDQPHLKQISRREAVKSGAFALAASLPASQLLAAGQDHQFRIGACDWSLKMPLSAEAFQFAQRHDLQGIQYSFGTAGNGLDLRLRKNRDTIRNTVRESGVAISSLGIGLLNKVPLATTDEAEQLVVECIETMVKLKEEAVALKDRDLAAKVSPDVALLAFFAKGDINGKPDLIENVIEKLKRLAPLAEKNGFTLGLETLLDEANHRHIMESVDSPAVKVYYDTANSARMGYDIYREIENLGSEGICEIHLKENGNLLGQGEIDFGKVKGLLEAMKYEGWLIIEGSVPKGMPLDEATQKNAAFARKLFHS